MLSKFPLYLAKIWHRRILLVMSSVFVCLLLPSVAQAGEGVTSGTPHPDINVCITGSVIDWKEEALAPNNGWTSITAIAYPSMRSATIPTNADGTFAVSLPTPIDTTYWEFTIALQPDWMGVTPTTFKVYVDVSDKSCKAIRFKLKKWVKVIVEKIDQYHTYLPNWTIHANPGPNNNFGQPQSVLTNASGQAIFHLTPGIWVFTESAPAGVHYVPIAPSSGAQTVDVQMPGPIVIRFKNRIKPKGCVDVNKRDTYGVGLPGWKFKLLFADGSVAQEGVTDAFGNVRFDHLLHGPYKVVETPQYGWTPVTPTHVEVTVGDGGYDGVCEDVWFENEQYHGYCIEGHKIDKNGNVGLPGWIINATPQTAGGYTPAAVTTDGTGHYRFDLPYNDYRIPGETYTVCETVQDGWEAHDGVTCHTITLPEKPGYCVEVPKFINKQVQYTTVDVEDGSGYGAGNHSEGTHVTVKHTDTHTDTHTDSADGCKKHHVVKHGEALYSIGNQHGKTAQQMLDANPWVRNQPHFYVYVNQKLCIP